MDHIVVNIVMPVRKKIKITSVLNKVACVAVSDQKDHIYLLVQYHELGELLPH